MKPENVLPEESPIAEPSEKMTPPATNDVSGNGYDPFNSGPGWPQSSDPYMDEGMGMDFAMDMGMDFEMNSSRSTTTTMYNNHRPTLDFNDDAITDDDFSFFDLPSGKTDGGQKFAIPSVPPLSASVDIHRESSHPWSFPMRASPTVEEVRTSGPGPPLQPALNNAPWTPATQDGHTPHAFNDSFDSRAPDLLPSSPGPSPDIQSSPETPTVQLVFDPAAKSEPTSYEHGPIAFDPIPFSTVHKSNDTKYTVGKFALPTPSPEPGYDGSPRQTPTSLTWEAKYISITNPRIRIVQRLIAARRKDSPNPQARRNSFAHGSWLDDEEFASISDNDSAQAMDVSSDSDSDDDDGSLECESPFDTRPTTPSPSYLPLGPTLLHFQFDHSQLLPLSTPLRSPGAIALSTSLSSSAPFAVPTPVSPAAALGAASEQSKSLESAAFAIVTEFVQNPLWAEIWSANNHRTGSLPNAWPDDIKAAADLLQGVRSAGGLPDMASLCGLGTFLLSPLVAP
jgi:mediator of RNA polymerase II transcription subunit 13